jgi:hypothetical protein
MNINLSIWTCDVCQHVMSIGTPSCPSCGRSSSGSEPSDPRDGPINRAKITALGDLLPEFRAIATLPESSLRPAANLTDDQVLKFFNRNELITDRLIGDVKDTLQRVDLSSETSVRSRETRQAMEDLLKSANAVRSVYDDLSSVHVPGQFSQLHLLLLSEYQELLNLHLSCAEAVLAITLEQVQHAQLRLQGHLDRMAELATLMNEEIKGIDVGVAHLDQLNRRLSGFVGETRQYESAGKPDFAAVLIAGLGDGQDFARLGRLAGTILGPILPFDPETLPSDQAFALFVAAAEVAASEDPLTVRRRAGLLLQLYDEAFSCDPVAMAASLVEAEADAQIAVGHLLPLGERLSTPREKELAIEAVRQELASAYSILTEWIYRPLLTLPLAAKQIVQGNPKPYSDLAHMDLGAKVNELTQTSDPRFAPALIGMSTIARNAGAHGDIDISGDKILLRQRDRKGVVKHEELTDDEFLARLDNLALTCHSLLLAAAICRIQHHSRLPPSNLAVKGRVASEAVRALVGLFGLSQAQVSMEGRERVVVKAVEQKEPVPDEFRKYHVAAYTLATIFQDVDRLILQVQRKDGRISSLEVPIAEVVTYRSTPKHTHPFSLLRLNYLTGDDSGDTTEPARVIREVITPGSRLLKQSIGKLRRLEDFLPASRDAYLAATDATIEKIQVFRSALKDLTLPGNANGPVASLLVGLDALSSGLIENKRRAALGAQSGSFREPNRHLERGERILNRWI